MNSGYIRRAQERDLGAILKCNSTSSTQSEERMVQISTGIENGHCLIWENEGLVDGFVLSAANSFFGSDFIDLLVVSTSMRRLGIGRLLLSAAVQISENKRVWTSTNNSNISMRELLHKEGWKLSGTLTGLDLDDDELVFYFDK
jgi:GNAT superfamily N-acetyltransferase